MVFSRGNTRDKEEFKINNNNIKYATEFRYLGISINRRGNFTPTLQDLSCKANKAIYALNSNINIKFLPPNILVTDFFLRASQAYKRVCVSV